MAELSIDKFKSRFDNGARPNRFSTQFLCPKLGINVEGVLCKSAVLPGRQLEVEDWSAYGPTQAFPTNVTHDGQRATFTFLCDTSFIEKQIFEVWQTFIYGNDPTPQFNHNQPKMSYMIDYTGEVQVRHYRNNTNSADDATKIVTLHEAFPIDVQAQALDYDSESQILLMSVVFAFRHFTTEYKQLPPPSDVDRAINTVRQIADIATDIASIGSTFGIKGADRVRRVANQANTAAGEVRQIDRILGSLDI